MTTGILLIIIVAIAVYIASVWGAFKLGMVFGTALGLAASEPGSDDADKITFWRRTGDIIQMMGEEAKKAKQ